MYIGVDFDGTCVTHAFPKIGENIGAQRVLKLIVENGHKIILHTMRSGNTLNEAEFWFDANCIDLFCSNYNPTQASWTKSPKPYCHLYIDDAALGCPLIYPGDDERPYVDWVEVEKLLILKGIINDTRNGAKVLF